MSIRCATPGTRATFLGVLNVDNNDYLDYMHARYYSPLEGRFLSADPVIDFKVATKAPQMWNRYSYVANNPMNRIDPDGRLIQFQNGDYTREVAFDEFRKLFAKDAQKYFSMDKNGYARLTGIGLAAFAKQFGAVAGRLASMVVQQGWTASVTLSDSSFAREGGGANTRSFGGNTRVDINPYLLENYGGQSVSMGGVQQSIGSAMSHELLGHAYPYAFGVDIMSPHQYGWMNRGPSKQEAYAIWAENQWRAQRGLPPRTFYTERKDYVPPDE